MRRPRFSLRSLILLVFTIGGAMGVWYRWEPWPGHRLAHPGVTGHEDVSLARFSPVDYGKIVTLSYKNVCIWNADTGVLIRKFSTEERFTDAAWSPDGSRIAAAGDAVQIWNWRTGAPPVSFAPEHYVRTLIFSGNGSTLLCSQYDGGSIWNAETGARVCRLDDSFHFAEFSPDNSFALFRACRINESVAEHEQNADRRGLAVLDMRSGKELLFVKDIGRHYSDFKFSQDSARLCARATVIDLEQGRINEYSCEWNIKTGEQVSEQLMGYTHDWGPNFGFIRGWTRTVSPDGTRKVVRSWQESALSVKDRPGNPLCQLVKFSRHSSAGRAHFSPDSRRIAAAKFDHYAYVWSRRRPEQWWGIAWLPEFWIAAISGLGLLLSLRRDWRERARKI